MKYDNASWHYGGDFPKELPSEAGATHSGMFLAWALLSGLAGEIHLTEMPEGIAMLRERKTTPGSFFLQFCDGKLTDEDFNDAGNAFATAYFDFDNGKYLMNYEASLLGALPSLYHVPDTWDTYEVLRPILDKRFTDWKANGS